MDIFSCILITIWVLRATLTFCSCLKDMQCTKLYMASKFSFNWSNFKIFLGTCSTQISSWMGLLNSLQSVQCLHFGSWNLESVAAGCEALPHLFKLQVPINIGLPLILLFFTFLQIKLDGSVSYLNNQLHSLGSINI